MSRLMQSLPCKGNGENFLFDIGGTDIVTFFTPDGNNMSATGKMT
jgi:hypothetical protein